MCLAALLVASGCSSSSDGGRETEDSTTDANVVDASDARLDGSDAGETDGNASETINCGGWDADWGDTPKPDVMSPCRSSCDCTGGFHCCAASAGLTCAPAYECP